MKQSWSSTVVLGLFSLVGFASVSHADTGPTPISDTRALTVPGDFRTTDDAVVLLSGLIGDTCQKLLAPVVDIDLPHQRITVTPLSQHVGTDCKEIYLKYHQSVSLGHLPEGHYLVETYDRRLSQELTIEAGE